MVCGLSNSGNNLVSQHRPEDDEIEPIERYEPMRPEDPVPVESPKKVEDEFEPAFDWAVKSLAENSLLKSSDLNQLSKISSYVNKNFSHYISIAEEVHSLLSGDYIPDLDPHEPVPYYALAKVRGALYKAMGPLFRFLNATRNYKKYHDLLLIGLYGRIPDTRDIKFTASKPPARGLKGSVKEHLDTPFADLSPNRKTERLAYYDMFYSLLKEKMNEIESIQEEYMIYEPGSKFEIDWINREIEVSEATLQSIMYLTKTKFRELFALVIDSEMEVRLIDVVLQCVLMSKAELFHIPDHPDVFRVKQAAMVVDKKETVLKESCAEILLTDTSVFQHTANFVENYLLRSSSVILVLNDCEYVIGGAENDFPVDQLKAHFLKELTKNETAKALFQSIKENPVLEKFLGKKQKLKTADLFEFFKEDCAKFNDVKARLKGSFIISRINQICDGIVFSKKELKDVSKELYPFIEFIFPLYLLQVIFMTNDNFADEFIKKYKSKNCRNGCTDKSFHILMGLDEHKFVFKTCFLKGFGTEYSIAGTLAISSFWSLGHLTMAPFKRIRFSPFISFETLAVLCDNIFLKFDEGAFKNDRSAYYQSLGPTLNAKLMEGPLINLKLKLEDVIKTREILCSLLKDRKALSPTDEMLKKFELEIREKHYYAKDAELSRHYYRIYGEDGFLRKGY